MQKKSIPFFSLAKQVKEHRETFLACIANILDTQNFVGGAAVQNFESALAKYLNAPHVISCNSGTDALWLALKALDLQPDTIVLTTPFSFIASSSEISFLGAHPVFIDVDEKTFNINPELIEAWLEKNTVTKKGQLLHKETGFPVVGMVLVDLFGQVAEFKKILAIAEKWGLWTVEDACQAIGAQEGDLKAGTLADIGTLSFYPTKNLGAYGDAGACVTKNPYLAERLLRLRNHGRKSHYEYEELGINSRLDGIQAAILTEKLSLIDAWNNRRRALAQRYQENLAGIDIITLPQEQYGHHVYHQFCITTETPDLRDALQKFLTDAGVGTNIFYPKSLTEISFLNVKKELTTACPVAFKKVASILALPIWPELEMDEIDYICEKIKEFAQPLMSTPKATVEKKRMKKEERCQQISLF